MAGGSTGEPQVKGLAFRTVLECYAELRGAAALEQAIQAMPKELRDAIRYHAIVSGGWYSISWYQDLLKTIADSSGEGLPMIRAIGRAATEKDLNRVYTTLLRWLNPTTIFGLYATLFSRYYSQGALQVEEQGAGYLRIRLTQCTGFDANIWMEIFGSAVRLLELSGVKNLRARFADGGGNGQDFAVLEGHWTS